VYKLQGYCGNRKNTKPQQQTELFTMTMPTIKPLFALILSSIIGLMGYGFYSQYVDGLEPCPLCMTQRFFYLLIGLFALIGLLHNKAKLYFGLIALSAIGGIATAGRQVWLQHLPPDQVPACGPGLQYMLETFPIGQTLRALITGDGNCAEVTWQFLGFSMAEWSLAWFIGFLTVATWQLCLKAPK
jgi:disulfide bond formation protein DsbB